MYCTMQCFVIHCKGIKHAPAADVSYLPKTLGNWNDIHKVSIQIRAVIPQRLYTTHGITAVTEV